MHSNKHTGVVLASIVFFNACVSTEIRSIQRNPDFHSAFILKVLIVSIASTPEIRSMVEQEFARQWKKRGVNAIASSSVLSPDITLDKAGVAPYAKDHGYDTVLVTRLIMRRKIKPHIHNPNVETDTSATISPKEADLTQYLNAEILFPQDDITYEVVVLRINLYNVSTEQLEWSCISHTLIAEDIPKRIGPFVKIVLKNLYQKAF